MSLKTGDVSVVIGSKNRRIRDRDLSLAMKKGFTLQKRAAEIEAELEAIKALVAKKAQDALRGQKGSVSFQTGRLNLRVSTRQEALVPEENVSRLRRLLGKTFHQLVREKKAYICSSKLIDGADSRISKLINIKQLKPRFNWQKQ